MFMCWNSVVKFSAKEITSSTKKIIITEKEYPSISICPNYPFKINLEDYIFKNDSISMQEIKKLIKTYSWSKEEIFYYVSYQTESNPGFECLTTKDSLDPRMPCSFPFTWDKDNICKNDSIDIMTFFRI